MAMLVVPMLRRRKVTRGDVRKWSAAAIVWNVLRLFCFVGLAFLTAFWLWWEPFSLYYAGGAAVLGGLIAVFLTRPRRREAKTLAKT